MLISIGLIIAVQGLRFRDRLDGLDPVAARRIWTLEQAWDRTSSGTMPTSSVIPMPNDDRPVSSVDGSGVGKPGPTEDWLYATWGVRLAARFLDFLFCMFVFVPVLAATTAGVAAATGTDMVFAFVLAFFLDLGIWELAYYVVGANHGQTVGKQALGICIVRDDTGGQVGFWRALGRQFLTIISTLVFMLGWLAPLWTPKRQTWHDSMAGTVVVRSPVARRAKPAVLWGLLWTVVTGLGVGAAGAWIYDEIDGSSYDWQLESDGLYGTDYEMYDSYDSYDAEGGINSDPSDGWCDDTRYLQDPDC